MTHESIEQVPGNPAKDQPESDLADDPVRVEMVPGKEQRHARAARPGRSAVVATKQAPGRAGIPPMDKLEKAGMTTFSSPDPGCAGPAIWSIGQHKNEKRQNGDGRFAFLKMLIPAENRKLGEEIECALAFFNSREHFHFFCLLSDDGRTADDRGT